MSEQREQILAVFVLDDDVAARRFLKAVEKTDDVDDNVKIVDAAFADRTKRGRVKIQQTTCHGRGRSTGIGVAVGAMLAGPAGAVVGGAAGGILAGVHTQLEEIGVQGSASPPAPEALVPARAPAHAILSADVDRPPASARSTCTSSAIHPDRVYHRPMSHSIQIRDVPDDVHRTLRARAAAARMSLSDYLLADITRLAERPPVSDVIQRAASRSGGADVGLIVEAVRSGRDRP